MHAVEFSRRALKDLEALAPGVGLRLVRKLKQLEIDPSPRGDTVKRLVGFSDPTYRFRMGDYRAVFQVADPKVQILRIVHRSELDRALYDLR